MLLWPMQVDVKGTFAAVTEMKYSRRKVIGLLLIGSGMLFAANGVIAGPRAFALGTAAVVGSVLAGALWVACGVAVLLQKTNE
jgi:hypothetical protein